MAAVGGSGMGGSGSGAVGSSGMGSVGGIAVGGISTRMKQGVSLKQLMKEQGFLLDWLWLAGWLWLVLAGGVG